jgi:hypothetical protein
MFAPLCFLEKTCFFGEDRKSRSSDCFFVKASLSVQRFDRALAYDVFSILLVVVFFLYRIKKNLGEFAGFFFLGLLDIACILA